MLGVKPARIEFHAKGKQRSLRIPNIGEMEISALEGQGGKDVVLENPSMTVVPEQPAIVAKSKKLTFHDHGWHWNISERNGFYSPFNIKGPWSTPLPPETLWKLPAFQVQDCSSDPHKATFSGRLTDDYSSHRFDMFRIRYWRESLAVQEIPEYESRRQRGKWVALEGRR